MNFKKIFLSVNLVLFALNSVQVFAQDVVFEKTDQQEVENKNMVQTIFNKLSEKQPLTKEEKEFLQAVKNYGLGSLGGLAFFYLVPPVGFGVIGMFLAKAALGAAGGFGLVELSKRIDWDKVKHSVQEIFGQER